MVNPLLLIFVEVVEQGSISKASARLFVSPTAVMKQMNQLEDHLGLKLMLRTPRGIQTTEAGMSIYRDAKEMVRLGKKALKKAYQLQTDDHHAIRVGSSALFPCGGLVVFWNSISELYPQYTLRVVPFEDANVNVPNTELGARFDIIAGVFDSDRTRNQRQFIQLGVYRFHLSMTKRHRLAGKEMLTLDDLHGERVMMMPSGNSPSNDRVRHDIEMHHPNITLVDAPYHYDMRVFNACAEGNQLLLTLEGWTSVHPSLVSIPLDVPYTIPYGIIASKHPGPVIMDFLEIVKQYRDA